MRKLRSLRAIQYSATLVTGLIFATTATAAVPPEPSGSAAEAAKVWPVEKRALAGAPNVIVILTDDVGFGASSTFGGLIPTPNLDRLAEKGVRYNNFNTTAMCSPTRASLLTGRYPHNAEMGMVLDAPSSDPGYTSVIPKTTVTVAEILKQNGYNTAMFGKAHVTPLWEMSMAGPFDRWPTGLGFEYFYGFMQGDTSQWTPALYENTRPISPPSTDPNYILDRDLTNRAIGWIRDQEATAPDKPFFMYFASGTAHAPNHAPAEWMAKFRGKFDTGWDAVRRKTFERQIEMGIIPAETKLSERLPEIPAWDSLSSDRKRLAARYMEAYAAQLSYFDFEMGRLFEFLETSGQMDNTMIIFIQGDNGASGEGSVEGRLDEQSWVNGFPPDDPEYALSRIDDIGGPSTYSLYPAGWAWALNSPFKWFKQAASHFGGTRNGMVITWPGKITKVGQVQSQFSHVADIVPTILEVAGIKAPGAINGIEQAPIDGISLAYSFNMPTAPSRRHVQVFELAQNLAIYKDGWMASTAPLYMPWEIIKPQKTVPLGERTWELYHVARDFSQAHDLASQEPERLRTLKELFVAEAGKNKILPVHAPGQGGAGRPRINAGRTQFSYHDGTVNLDRDAAPAVLGRSYTIAARVEVARAGGPGVIVAQGGRFGGYSLYLDKFGRLSFGSNAVAPDIVSIRSKAPLSIGKHAVTLQFTHDGAGRSGGTAVLKVDGIEIARGRVEKTLRTFPLGEGLDIGSDLITPVVDDYTSPARFPGKIEIVSITLH